MYLGPNYETEFVNLSGHYLFNFTLTKNVEVISKSGFVAVYYLWGVTKLQSAPMANSCDYCPYGQ